MTRQGVLLVLAGVGSGWLIAAAGAGLLRSTMFGVSTTEPAAYVLAGAGLAAAALAASILPALRVTRIDPASVLWSE